MTVLSFSTCHFAVVVIFHKKLMQLIVVFLFAQTMFLQVNELFKRVVSVTLGEIQNFVIIRPFLF